MHVPRYVSYLSTDGTPALSLSKRGARLIGMLEYKAARAGLRYEAVNSKRSAGCSSCEAVLDEGRQSTGRCPQCGLTNEGLAPRQPGRGRGESWARAFPWRRVGPVVTAQGDLGDDAEHRTIPVSDDSQSFRVENTREVGLVKREGTGKSPSSFSLSFRWLTLDVWI